MPRCTLLGILALLYALGDNMQNAQIGHFAVDISDKHFDLIPSFRNMAKIASADRLLLLYDVIHSTKATTDVLINLSREILLACSSDSDIEQYLVKTQRRKAYITPRSISVNDQIVVAAALMRHGIAGVNRPKTGLKKSVRGMEKFDVYSFVADAKNHFNMSLEEAWGLTMTEFCYHLASHFPPESAEHNAPSLDAHKEAMKAMMEGDNHG